MLKNTCWFKHICDKWEKEWQATMTLQGPFWLEMPQFCEPGSLTWKHPARRRLSAEQWCSLTWLPHFPHFFLCPEGGLRSPQNHLKCIQDLWAHCLQFYNWHFTVTRPKGDSRKTCWSGGIFQLWRRMLIIQRSHPGRCPNRKLMGI